MARLRSNAFVAALLLLCGAGEAVADGSDNYIYNYLGRSDTITIGAGDASRANLAIQHPTPWPSYVNDTAAPTRSQIGISAMERMFDRYRAQGSATAPPSTSGAGTPD